MVCGYGSNPLDVPADIRDALKAYVVRRYEKREEDDDAYFRKLFNRFSWGQWPP